MRSLAIVVVLAGTAAADPRGMMFGAPPVSAVAPQGASPYIYLNRCVGGCTIHGGALDDAASHASTLPCNGGATCNGGACFCTTSGTGSTFTIKEFVSSTGQIGAAADAEWNAIVQCVKEVYSPYAVVVSDQLPNGVLYNEEIIAGNASDIGWMDNQVGGIAPGPNGTCTPENDVMSFTFANEFQAASDRVHTLCGIAGQESAHAYGLDHEYMFPDGGGGGSDSTSACNDPMSYRGDCGGQRFFRNHLAKCGEFAPRACRCGGEQDSHLKILAVFGPAAPITRPPHVELIMPAAGDTLATTGAAVQVTAGAQRGVARLELWLNNYNWLTVKGASFGPTGQPDPSSYALPIPAAVPDSVIDLVVKAFDDIDVETDTPTVTVTKGAPCATAATCAKGQACDAGKCYWAAPTGQLGDACTYPQFCTSGICQGTADKTICTQDCVVGSVDSCPASYDCLPTSNSNGICFPHDAGGGCCSAQAGAGWIPGALVVLGFVIRRRRR